MIQDYKNKSPELIVREIDGVVYTEEWKPVVECPTKYHISSFGRLKRLGYQGCDKWIPDKIIGGGLTKKGYVRFILKYGGKGKSRYAHRLVGLAFIQTIKGKPDINHIKCIKTHNHFSVLEWCTPQENNEHGVKFGLLKRGVTPRPYVRKGFNYELACKKIINIETGEVYKNIDELCSEKALSKSIVGKQLRGDRYCHLPYRYLGEEHLVCIKPIRVKKEKPPKKERPPRKVYIPHPAVYRKIIMMDKAGNELQVFNSSGEAAKHVNSNADTFRKAIKNSPNNFTKGYIWKYA